MAIKFEEYAYDAGYDYAPYIGEGYDSDNRCFQSFTAESSHTISSVKIYIFSIKDTLSKSVILEIIEGGTPAQTVLATKTIALANLTVGQMNEFVFSESISVISGSIYGIECRLDISGTDYARWAGMTVGGEAYGSHWYYNGLGHSGWYNHEDYDLFFEVWGEAIIFIPKIMIF